jgi:galactokinase
MNKFLETRINKLKEDFKNVFAETKGLVAFNSPGRINIIGEHTDYNGGYVLPIAINLSIIAVASKRNDRKIYLKSQNFSKKVAASIDGLKYHEKREWANYPLSIAWVLEKKGIKLSGANVVFEGNIPLASGLSSSAAIEVLMVKILLSLSENNIEEKQIPILCKEAENDFIGVKSGIMDQFVITFGKENNAILLNCETLEHRLIPFYKGKNMAIIIGNTKVKRELVKSAYNERVKECNKGLEILRKHIKRPNISNLSNITKQEFEEYREKLPSIIEKRCEHVISENRRVKYAADALETGDLVTLGELLIKSHNSLRELYEVSCNELDIMVDSFLISDNVYGARMTGAGFGGSVIALTKDEGKEEVITKASREYKERTGIRGEFYVCRISDGVKKI